MVAYRLMFGLVLTSALTMTPGVRLDRMHRPTLKSPGAATEVVRTASCPTGNCDEAKKIVKRVAG